MNATPATGESLTWLQTTTFHRVVGQHRWRDWLQRDSTGVVIANVAPHDWSSIFLAHTGLQFAIMAPVAAGTRVDRLVADISTRTDLRLDVRSALRGTSLAEVVVEPLPSSPPITRMARLRQLAPLSLREWAAVFDVTHTAIRGWLHEDPDRPELAHVLDAVERAARVHPDVGRWLQTVVPGTDVQPIQLLRERRWRAFTGAIHAVSAPVVSISTEALVERRKADLSWAEAELPAAGDV